ncbi:MAG TPA: DNA primase [Micromonosporaceae bacterium]|nr:DNA primase [Micromonosporaceae bacterium]
MARPPAGRPSADEPDPTDDESVPIDEDDEAADEDEDELDDDEEDDDEEDDVDDEDDELEDEDAVNDEDSDEPLAATPRRTSTAEHFWQRVRVDPVEVALPAGVGYTLRAYRQNTDITPADVSDREQDVALPTRRAYVEASDLDDSDLDGRAGRRDKDDADEDNLDEYEDELAADDDDEDEDAEEDVDETAMVDEDVVEEVPVFLSHRGHLLVFRSAESLVDFVLSDAEHDLQQIDTWESVSRGIRPEYVVASSDDTYELDLVVKNLRGGQDVWDPPLLIRAGQFARDLSHALRVEPVMLALAPGAPLDELDDALRVVADGGLTGFFARRRLKKVGAESASLGWRTVIGKISAIVDWRD